MSQIITIAPDGTISGLQRKPNQGIDLTKFGKASVERASEIVWDEETQRWFIDVKTGPLAGRTVTTLMWFEAVPGCPLPHSVDCSKTVSLSDPLFFESYDEAVAVEIKVLDGFRTQGVF